MTKNLAKRQVIVRATAEAQDAVLDLEEMEDEELSAVRARYLALARKTRRRRKNPSFG